jgi:predicted RNA-binding protein with RPS1 domain
MKVMIPFVTADYKALVCLNKIEEAFELIHISDVTSRYVELIRSDMV